MNKALLCNAMLVLLARYRVPQVVLLTEQADPRQNGVYEVMLDGYGDLARVGDPARRSERVKLGAGWAVSDWPDEHGFCPVVQVIDTRTTEAIAARFAEAFGPFAGTYIDPMDRWAMADDEPKPGSLEWDKEEAEWARRHGKKVST